MQQGKIIGLGGVFIKFKDPKVMTKWYKEVLELNTNDYGVLFAYNHSAKQRAFLQLGAFDVTTGYFGKEEQHVMLNFRVINIEKLIQELREKNIKIVNEIENYDFGKFIHIEDPEGNRIELWEPVDEAFETKEPFHDMF